MRGINWSNIDWRRANWRRTNWRNPAKAATGATLLLALLLTFNPIVTHSAWAAWGKRSVKASAPAIVKSSQLVEAAPPAVIQELQQAFDDNKPQVSILSPRANEVLTDDRVSIRLQVKDLTIFKDELGLGPHLHVILDNEPYRAVYDSSEPLVLEQLAPGTHTIRAFASRPWHESFKNEGAYAQTTFHVFTKTQDNSPDPNLPLLTYSRPEGHYGAEPILLDFYLTNAPLHLVAREDKQDDVADWRIRCTVNGNSFILDEWQPIYLKGFKPGKNWVQLEFLNENGSSVKNVFNNTARLITYEPGGKDLLSQLVRGELSATAARSIVDPNYTPPTPEPTPTPSPIVTPSPIPSASPSASPPPSPTPSVEPLVKTVPTPTPSSAPVEPESIEPEPIEPTPSSTPAADPVPPTTDKPEPTATPFPVISVPQPTEESPPAEEPAAAKATPQPKPQPEPQQKFINSVQGFFKRLRPPTQASEPAVKPVPNSNPVSNSNPVVEPPSLPESIEIVPESGEVERPEPALQTEPSSTDNSSIDESPANDLSADDAIEPAVPSALSEPAAPVPIEEK